ncbi:MAG: hypothetical protein PVJ57_10850 [Phycisphaerae bacterium]|jgi:hypothetical protein
MTAVPGRTDRARRWRRRGLHLVIALLLVGWCTRYVYLRLTVEPPRRVEDIFEGVTTPGPPKPDDVTAEVTEHVLALTEDVPLVLPAPPAGMRWERPQSYRQNDLDMEDVARGEWTPADRPHLQAAITHLTDDATRQRLAALRDLRGRPWQYDHMRTLQDGYEGIDLTHMREMAAHLTADARYQHAERGDLAMAWEDLQSALWLAQPESVDTLIVMLVRESCFYRCLTELQHMSREHTLDDALAADIDRVLRQLPTPSQMWSRAIAGNEVMYQTIIDTCYTRDASGHGWYVLSRQRLLMERLLTEPPGEDAAQHPLWNLTSFLYSDRRTVEAKWARYCDDLRRLPELTYADAATEMDRLYRRTVPFSLVDGPALRYAEVSVITHGYRRALDIGAAVDGTRLAIALSRFRSERGVYPETLAELTPTYIADFPLDPFGDAPFLYRRDGDGYVLYCRGRDGDDDGGVAYGAQNRSFDDYDVLYSSPRPYPKCEPELVPTPIGQFLPEPDSEDVEP